jgi:hypothetical protein
MTALHTHPDANSRAATPAPRRRVRMGAVNVAPLAASVATLLAIAWVVSFQHQHSSLYDTAPHPDRPAAIAGPHP